ncbi:hypothetical protein EYC80_001264 [Monilinia laxa]|uniref:Uncharacterized protein n=1 Tax=Monilinia laxa TaxID=61186 RepID=A0A5N6K8S5_MONLA|nr:hypothetical protein EYC80_001264 [Monilinia laxa]
MAREGSEGGIESIKVKERQGLFNRESELVCYEVIKLRNTVSELSIPVLALPTACFLLSSFPPTFAYSAIFPNTPGTHFLANQLLLPSPYLLPSTIKYPKPRSDPPEY